MEQSRAALSFLSFEAPAAILKSPCKDNVEKLTKWCRGIFGRYRLTCLDPKFKKAG